MKRVEVVMQELEDVKELLRLSKEDCASLKGTVARLNSECACHEG